MMRDRWGAIGATAALVALSTMATGLGSGPAAADAGDGTITVTVIRDVNANSNYDPLLEVGQAGIRVTVTDDVGTQLSAFTDAAGVVTFDPATATPTLVGGRYRVEATIPPTMPYLQPAQVAGGDLSPLTDFVDVGGGAPATLTMGVINPADYVGPTPRLVTAYQWPNNTPPPTLVDDQRSLISFNYSDRGSPNEPGYPAPTAEATQDVTGTVYGIATQRGTGNIFAGAFAKRITAYGPEGEPGAIYVTRADDTTALWGIVPDAGDADHGPINSGDFGFWDAVGKQALGDLDMAEDDSTLFVVNLNDRSLYAFDATADSMGAPLSVTPIPDPGCPNVGGVQDWRPFGLGMRDGVLYVGGVCSGESTGLRADVEAHVWAFDTAAATFGAAPVLSQTLDFLKGGVAGPQGEPVGDDILTHWNAWLPTYDTVTVGRYSTAGYGLPSQTHRRPMPMLTDLAVEADGDLVLGFRDRTGDQFGFQEASPRGPGTLDSTMVGGDLNRACRNLDGSYSWEGTGGCPNNHVHPNGGTGQDPAVVEYYAGEYFGVDAAHAETSQGAIALALSEPRMAVNSLDPRLRVTAGGPGFYDRQTGQMWSNTGANAYELFADGRAYFEPPGGPSPDYTFGKGNGLADLEVLAALSPLEIGNYVWFDADRDGVQDPGEDPVAGVVVELLDAAGGVVGTAVTDANGNYYFGGSGNVNMANGQPLSANTDYVVRIPDAIGAAQQAPLAGWVLTQTDAGASDTIDNDGALVGVDAQVAITTGGPGFNNHTYDFGFYEPVYDLALRKTLAAGQPSAVNPGDLVTFTITVFNQGLDAVSNVTVVDYIPAGMTLEDPDWTSGPGNTARTVLAGPIAPGASAPVDISLRLSAVPFDGPKDNHAEIESFTDEWGGDRDDEDSTPDDEFGNDSRVDDEIDNGGGDEDDEDVASVTVSTPAPPTTTTTTLPPPTTGPPVTPPPAPSTQVPNPGALPATGGSSNVLGVLALLLVLSGAGVLIAARLRRPAR